MPILFDNLTEPEWLKLKEDDISSTEIACLYDKSPYKSAFAIFNEKAKIIQPDKLSSPRIFWGRVYESSTAHAIKTLYGVEINKISGYMRHDDVPKMSASFDFEIIGLTENWQPFDNDLNISAQDQQILRNKFINCGPGILEIKIVDQFQFKENWSEDEAPLHIEFQAQQQMEIAKHNWCVIVASVIGNNLNLYLRDRDEEIGKAFCQKINEFWAAVKTGQAPEPNYDEDLDALKKLYSKNNNCIADFFGNDNFNKLCNQYQQVSDQVTILEGQKTRLKAEILNLVKNSSEAISDAYQVKFTEVKPVLPTKITADMVGQEIGGRKGYRQMNIKQLLK